MKMLLLLSLLCLLSVLCSAYPDGPPIHLPNYPRVCLNMFPVGHLVEAQTSPPPFTITTNECYNAGIEIKVVSAVTDAQLQIAGFFIQARKQSGADQEVAVGTFRVEDPMLKTLDCNGNLYSAASHQLPSHDVDSHRTHLHGEHSQPKTKHNIEDASSRIVYWRAPKGLTEDVQFNATLVIHVKEFWTSVTSPLVRYNATCSTATPSGTFSTLAMITAVVVAIMVEL